MLSVIFTTFVDRSYVATILVITIDYTVKLCEDVGYSDKMSMPTGDQNITLIITQLHTIILVTLWLLPFATCTTHNYLWASVCYGGRIEWGTPNLTLPMCQWVSLTLTHTRHVPLNVYCIEMAIRTRGESKATTNLRVQDTTSHHCIPPPATIVSHHQPPLYSTTSQSFSHANIVPRLQT